MRKLRPDILMLTEFPVSLKINRFRKKNKILSFGDELDTKLIEILRCIYVTPSISAVPFYPRMS